MYRSLEVQAVPSACSVTIRVSGDVETTVACELESVLRQHLAPGRRLLLDLSAVGFIGSAGVHALLEAKNSALEAEGDVVVVECSGIVRRALHLANSASLFGLAEPA